MKITELLEYDEFVDKRWVNDHTFIEDIAHASLGLCGEAGEVAEHIKKFIRGDGALSTDKVCLELGDTLYYLVKVAHLNGFRLADIISANTRKLEGRAHRGTIQGSGDNR